MEKICLQAHGNLKSWFNQCQSTKNEHMGIRKVNDKCSLPLSNFFPSGSMSLTSKISSNKTPAMVVGAQTLDTFSSLVIFSSADHAKHSIAQQHLI
jgi:hypothetical protein